MASDRAISTQQILRLLGMESGADPRSFERVSSFDDAGPDSIVFAEQQGAVEAALLSAAGLILVPLASADTSNPRLLAVRNPRYAFALIGQALAAPPAGIIHPAAVVEASARIGEGTSIGAGSFIEAGASLGAGCEIGPNVTIHGSVTLGARCIVQANSVLGSTGFGYVTGPDGCHLRFPQQGTLRIEDDVEIGAGCTIDRGALGETRIGRGTKLDNLVHIAHNCRIGDNVIIAAQVGMAGSCVIEDGAMLGGQVGLGERVTIGSGVMLGGQGGVLPGKALTGKGEVFWGTPARPVKEYLRDLVRLRRKG